MIIIYKTIYGYECTNEENYNAPIQNANEIQKLHYFKSPEQIIDYFCKYYNYKPQEFKIIN